MTIMHFQSIDIDMHYFSNTFNEHSLQKVRSDARTEKLFAVSALVLLRRAWALCIVLYNRYTRDTELASFVAHVCDCQMSYFV